MTINDFIDEYDNLTEPRKVEFLQKLVSKLVKEEVEEFADATDDDVEPIARTIIGDLLEACVMEEENDYFGTEGFNG